MLAASRGNSARCCRSGPLGAAQPGGVQTDPISQRLHPPGTDTPGPRPTSPSPAQAHRCRSSRKTSTAKHAHSERRATPDDRRDGLTAGLTPQACAQEVPVMSLSPDAGARCAGPNTHIAGEAPAITPPQIFIETPQTWCHNRLMDSGPLGRRTVAGLSANLETARFAAAAVCQCPRNRRDMPRDAWAEWETA